MLDTMTIRKPLELKPMKEGREQRKRKGVVRRMKGGPGRQVLIVG